MKKPRRESSAGDRNAVSLVTALVIAALVPAVCVLWFMSVAMRNERLAVQERMADVYANQLASLQRQAEAFWKERAATLQTTTTASPAARFAAVVGAGLADAVVVFDSSGQPAYPAALAASASTDSTAGWTAAQELEFQKRDFTGAAAAYARIAESADTVHNKAHALLAEAGALLKAADQTSAIERLSQVAGDPALRNAVSAQGMAIAPNAQLLLLKTLGTEVAEAVRLSPEARNAHAFRYEQTLTQLMNRLNDYSDASMPAAQRRFLMREVKALATAEVERHSTAAGTPRPQELFPTLAAEDLAADYLETEPTPPATGKLQRAPLPRVWRLATTDRSLVALFREERIKAELGQRLGALAPAGVRATFLAPDEPFSGSKLVPPQPAGEFLPGWRIGLRFDGADPFAEASQRQTQFYLWTGSVVVVVIALLAWLVARTVSAQMRLARLKNELVSTVSHELKTPLASMRALVDTLAGGRYHSESQLREYLQLVSRENQRLSHLIENFLTFSRLERGQARFHFDAVSPLVIVRGADSALREKLNAPGCTFTVDVDPALPAVRGDVEALTTVIINLLDNAWKYSGPDKHIAARACTRDDGVCFEVRDNGIGLQSDEKKRIFERFYQVDQSLTRQRGGCGLGLSIVQSIVRAHDGTVEVESEPGAGSTFRVTIPVAGAATGPLIRARASSLKAASPQSGRQGNAFQNWFRRAEGGPSPSRQ